jgi:hypothetical protein
LSGLNPELSGLNPELSGLNPERADRSHFTQLSIFIY